MDVVAVDEVDACFQVRAVRRHLLPSPLQGWVGTRGCRGVGFAVGSTDVTHAGVVAVWRVRRGWHTAALPAASLRAQAHPEEMELIMQLACRQQGQQGQQGGEQQQEAPSLPPPRQQDVQQVAAGQGGEQQEHEEQARAAVPPFRQKPVVILVGATLDEPLVEHVVTQVRAQRG